MELRGADQKWQQDREALRHIISQWNANRLDLFSLSEPNEDFEFHGVMRFYFQDAGQKIATKCIRVSSTASTQAVIETLIEKFRPDMKMLHMAEYALYEIHPNGEERCLGCDEKPLLVQLNWHKDDREGRFLLRRADEKSTLPATQPPEESSFRRKLSKREKRNMKKENKLRKLKSSGNSSGADDDPSQSSAAANNKGSVAEKLYTELPETSFTRSISNPEAVMRRRRQQKLERKLQLFRSKDGGPDTGGTLKIYGESLCKDVPYKTLLLSVRETAAYVVREMLDKYGLNKEDPANYCLVQVSPSGGEDAANEYILEDDECPLSILMHHSPSQGPVMFHVRRRPADQQARRRKKKLSGSSGGAANSSSSSTINRSNHPDSGMNQADDDRSMLPFLLELNPDGSEVRQGGVGVVRRHVLPPTVTEVGSERPHPAATSPVAGPSIQLFGPGIHPRHCVVAHTEGIVTLTPCSPQAETYVNGQRIYETTLLQHGSVIRFGRSYQFRFIDPSHEFRTAPHPQMQNYVPNRPQQMVGTDPILPAVLELPEEVEDAFLHALIPNLDSRQVAFRLAPTYALYLMARYRASTHFRPELNPMERAQRLTLTLSRVGAMMQAVVQERYADPPSLAFWMANASELLHFLKSDRHICAFSLDGQDLLAEAVQSAFRNASVCLTGELLQSLPPMLQEKEESPDDEVATAQVLAVLSSTMGLLRRCRVNAALTIQLFSQLFHALNAAIFNRLVGLETPRLPAYQPPPGGPPNFCSRQWGVRLSKRLRRLEAWAERQGLELAADCHLARVMQAAHLLQAPKTTPEQLADVASACFKLNSLQLQALLERYRPAPDEPQMPPQLIAAIVRVAEATADELQLADGRPLRLEEDSQLAVPFLLPDDGYSCDVMRGIPTGLTEVLSPLQQQGLCRLTPQPTSSGLWTIYMGEGALPPRAPSAVPAEQPAAQHPPQQPELQVLHLRKASDSMGLSIVAARGTGQQQLGIYIKSVVKGGSADVDGRLQAGDQLLSVDGNSLVGITQDRAAEILMGTGHTVRLEVAKQAAMYHGLATLLSQPSPTSTVSRSTLNLSVSKQQERRPPLPQQQQTQQPYQERLVDWDRPPNNSGAPNRNNSNSSPSLVAAAGEPVGAVPAAQAQRNSVTLRSANSKSVPALHEANNGQEPIQELYPPQQHPHHHPHHQQQAQRMMANQRTMSAQHLPPPPPQQQQQRYPPGPAAGPMPTSPTRLQAPHFGSSPPPPMTQQQQLQLQQQQQQMRSRSVQNLSEAQLQQQQMQQMNNRSSLRARHPSNPSMVSEEERQYQNIQLYQHQQQQQLQMQQQQLYSKNQYTQQQQQQQQQLYNQQMQQQQQRGLLSPVNRHLRAPSSLAAGALSNASGAADSPPPPPPPPTSTHPLLSQQQQQQQQQQQNATGPSNPWDREEKEREVMRRQEAARIWMEEQINELEGLGPHGRTPKQEEQLRAMKLEMEFRKRAQEAAKDEEDEEGEDEEEGVTSTSMDRRGMLRLVQEDLERARQWRLEKQAAVTAGTVTGHHQPQQFHIPQQQQQQSYQYQQQPPAAPLVNGGSNNGPTSNNNNTSSVPDQERLRKIETFQRKQRELEATQAAEERILREAQRRKEEESAQRQQWRGHPLAPPVQTNAAPSQRLDSLVSGTTGIPPQVAYQPPAAPPPPPPTSQAPEVAPSREPKRVSFFQDKPVVTHTYDDNANQEKNHLMMMSPTGREDPDAFIQEAENMLAGHNTPMSGMKGITGDQQLLLTGVSTPGVIGAQEVYRDPRLRRLAEQQQQKAQLKAPGPEKLSFQEKMRMFALESGEPQTPKDKSKASKAQREIELKPSPLAK